MCVCGVSVLGVGSGSAALTGCRSPCTVVAHSYIDGGGAGKLRLSRGNHQQRSDVPVSWKWTSHYSSKMTSCWIFARTRVFSQLMIDLVLILPMQSSPVSTRKDGSRSTPYLTPPLLMQFQPNATSSSPQCCAAAPCAHLVAAVDTKLKFVVTPWHSSPPPLQ